MKIHEHQARALFARYGIETNPGKVAGSPEEAFRAAGETGCPVVVKAQVLAGGRGKAGGVKLARTPVEAREAARAILGLTIKGFPVHKVLVARALDIGKEYYLGITVDREAQAVAYIASASGGVDIEELAARDPGAILTFRPDPLAPADDRALDRFLSPAFPERSLRDQASRILRNLDRLFRENDCSVAEINPLALIDGGRLLALDAKVAFDDNALFKHPELQELRNPEEASEDESAAEAAGLSFVSLDGEIGCIVNGAGLAMATMDLIKLFGGSPANFLDVGGSSNPEKVIAALSILARNPRLSAILINIFGGITRCDDIARGIILARERVRIPVPLVIRLIGTNDRAGRRILEEAGLSAATEFTDAVRTVVACASADPAPGMRGGA